jgi:hypothetical protein
MIPKLRPGEEITPAKLNAVIDAVNAAHITSSDFPLERTAAGTKLKMARREQDFYAEIIEPLGDDGEPIRPRGYNDEIRMGEYEWREVYLPTPTDADEVRYGNESLFRELPGGRGSVYDSNTLTEHLHNPAFELSGNYHVPIGTLVRMRVYQPVHEKEAHERGFLRRYVFHYEPAETLFLAWAAEDWEENGTYPEGNPRVKCKRLVADPDTAPTATEPHPKTELAGGDEFIWVELPRERKGGYGGVSNGQAHSADPAIYWWDRLYYSVDDQGRNICMSPYLHMGKIGEIRMLGKTPSTGDPWDEIPTGWRECDGSLQTGNAGNITLANFDRDYTALSGNADQYGAGPVHKSSSYAVGDQCMHATFDAHGESVFARIPQTAAAWYDTSEELAAPNNHRHDIKSAQGEFPMETVFFYQRYK